MADRGCICRTVDGRCNIYVFMCRRILLQEFEIVSQLQVNIRGSQSGVHTGKLHHGRLHGDETCKINNLNDTTNTPNNLLSYTQGLLR